MFHVYCNLPLYNKPILLSLKVIASEIIGSVPTTDYTVIDIRTAVQTRRGAEITTEKDIVNKLILHKSNVFFFLLTCYNYRRL